MAPLARLFLVGGRSLFYSVSLAVVLGCAVAVAMLGLCACSNDRLPGRPGRTLQSLVITGASTLGQPGTTSQLTAIGTYSDGETGPVMPTQLYWQSTVTSVATVAAGQVIAKNWGRTEIRAGQDRVVSNLLPVQVLPEGGFLVTGTVTEEGYYSSAASVELTSSLGTITATTSDLSQEAATFRLPAVGSARLRVSKDGYVEQAVNITANGDQQVDVDLRSRVSGDYVVVFTAAPSCDIPAFAKKRSYDAALRRTYGTNMFGVIRPTPPVMFSRLISGFRGWITGNRVVFTLSDTGDGDFDSTWLMDESIDGVGMLKFNGTATGAVSDGVIDTTFSGNFYFLPAGDLSEWRCQADDHRLQLIRR